MFLFQDPEQKTFRKKLRNEATFPEQLLWSQLKGRRMAGCKFVRQYGVGPYILDFYCREKRLGIEIDGGQHSENEFYDQERTKFLESQGIKVIRFWNNDVLRRLDVVCEEIWESLDVPPP